LNGKDDAAMAAPQDKDLARGGTVWPYDARNPITAVESPGRPPPLRGAT
jgi:hypothetical protein